MGNYALFGGNDHYPNGGWRDLLYMYETKEEAEYAGESHREGSLEPCVDWYQVVDLLCKKIVAEG